METSRFTVFPLTKRDQQLFDQQVEETLQIVDDPRRSPKCYIRHPFTRMISCVQMCDNSHLKEVWSEDMIYYFSALLMDRYVNKDVRLNLYRDGMRNGPLHSFDCIFHPFIHEGDWNLVIYHNLTQKIVFIDCSSQKGNLKKFTNTNTLKLNSDQEFLHSIGKLKSFDKTVIPDENIFKLTKIFTTVSRCNAINVLAVIYGICCTKNILDYLVGIHSSGFNKFDVNMFFIQEIGTFDRHLIDRISMGAPFYYTLEKLRFKKKGKVKQIPAESMRVALPKTPKSMKPSVKKSPKSSLNQSKLNQSPLETSVKETTIKETTVRKITVKETTIKETAVKESPTKGTPKQSPLKQVPAKQDPAIPTPSKQTPAKLTLKEPLLKQIPLKETSINSTSINAPSINETSINSTSNKQAPIKQTPLKSTPIKQTPIETSQDSPSLLETPIHALHNGVSSALPLEEYQMKHIPSITPVQLPTVFQVQLNAPLNNLSPAPPSKPSPKVKPSQLEIKSTPLKQTSVKNSSESSKTALKLELAKKTPTKLKRALQEKNSDPKRLKPSSPDTKERNPESLNRPFSPDHLRTTGALLNLKNSASFISDYRLLPLQENMFLSKDMAIKLVDLMKPDMDEFEEPEVLDNSLDFLQKVLSSRYARGKYAECDIMCKDIINAAYVGKSKQRTADYDEEYFIEDLNIDNESQIFPVFIHQTQLYIVELKHRIDNGDTTVNIVDLCKKSTYHDILSSIMLKELVSIYSFHKNRKIVLVNTRKVEIPDDSLYTKITAMFYLVAHIIKNHQFSVDIKLTQSKLNDFIKSFLLVAKCIKKNDTLGRDANYKKFVMSIE